MVHWRQQVEAELRRTDGAEPQREGRAHSDQHVQQKRSPDDLQRERQEERKTGRGAKHGEGEIKEGGERKTKSEGEMVRGKTGR